MFNKGLRGNDWKLVSNWNLVKIDKDLGELFILEVVLSIEDGTILNEINCRNGLGLYM